MSSSMNAWLCALNVCMHGCMEECMKIRQGGRQEERKEGRREGGKEARKGSREQMMCVRKCMDKNYMSQTHRIQLPLAKVTSLT